MLNIKECRKYLKDSNHTLTDEQVTKIRDFFYQVSDWIVKTLNKQENGNQESDTVHQGIDR